MLATVLFTDMPIRRCAPPKWVTSHGAVCSTSTIERRVRWEKISRRFSENDGNGILATFDGPGRAIRCALDFEAAALQIGLPLRAGLHTGEVERRDGDIGGIAVHAAARVMAPLQPWRSSRITSGNGPGSGRGVEILRAGFARAQGSPGQLGPVRRKHLNVVFKRRRVFQ